MESITLLQQELLLLANQRLPEAARDGGYPVRLNHCFLRIIYDTLFEQSWKDVLPKGRAAYKQLSAGQLKQAIAIGESLLASPARCYELNQMSLAYRGKLK